MDININDLRVKTIISEILLRVDDLEINSFSLESKNETYYFEADKNQVWKYTVRDEETKEVIEVKKF